MIIFILRRETTRAHPLTYHIGYNASIQKSSTACLPKRHHGDRTVHFTYQQDFSVLYKNINYSMPSEGVTRMVQSVSSHRRAFLNTVAAIDLIKIETHTPDIPLIFSSQESSSPT